MNYQYHIEKIKYNFICTNIIINIIFPINILLDNALSINIHVFNAYSIVIRV